MGFFLLRIVLLATPPPPQPYRNFLENSWIQDKRDDSKFCIQHPKKSFTVSAKTAWNKKAWMTAISGASQAALLARIEG